MLRVAIAALALSAVACGSDPSPPAVSGMPRGADPVEYTGATAGFYVPPDPLPPGVHGDLVRFQRLPGVAGGQVYRVMYRSESVAGDPIAVTGLVGVPPDGGDGTVLTWAHGTAGLADRCAPSKEPDDNVEPIARLFFERGWVVAATDYEGLGTPGRHPYLAGISEGRGTLDIVLAARQLPAAVDSTKTMIWGHSQGGHAALFAAQLAPAWTPDLEIVGTVAGAPATELSLLARALRGGDYQGYIAMAAGGLNAAYPEATLAQVLTPRGLDLLDVLDEGCLQKVFDVYDDLRYEEFIKTEPTEVEPWRTILAENDPGHVAMASPLLLIHGEDDRQIPPITSQILFERLCRIGQVAERRTYPGVGHTDVILPSMPDMLRWMDDRAAGTPPVNGCPTD